MADKPQKYGSGIEPHIYAIWTCFIGDKGGLHYIENRSSKSNLQL